MGKWISLGSAQRHGICANVRFPLPASSVHAAEVMEWRVMQWLMEAAGWLAHRHCAITSITVTMGVGSIWQGASPTLSINIWFIGRTGSRRGSAVAPWIWGRTRIGSVNFGSG